jgi:uncharacterized protein YkwD
MAVAGCAAEDLEVVTGPDPDATTPTADVVVDDPADEEAEEEAAGGGTDAVGPEETSTSTSSSSTTSSTTTTTEPDQDGDEGDGDGSDTTPTDPAPPDTSNSPPAQSGMEVDRPAAAQSVAFVNDRRREHDRGQLQVDAELQALAEGWAQRMAEDEDMRHNPNLGDQMPDHYYAWGENVAYGFDPSAINQGWWESEGHRENMLSGNYTAIGVGFVVDEDGDYWAVQVFAG